MERKKVSMPINEIGNALAILAHIPAEGLPPALWLCKEPGIWYWVVGKSTGFSQTQLSTLFCHLLEN